MRDFTRHTITLLLFLLTTSSLFAQREVRLISEIQGEGAQSTMVDDTVMVEAVVSGVYVPRGDELEGLGGFFLMEEVEDRDGNPMTSEGIFVYAPFVAPGLYPTGTRVQVTGVVKEYETSGGRSSLTEITSVAGIVGLGGGPPLSPVTVDWPEDGSAGLERYEGMTVRFRTPMYVIENRNLDLFGEYRLAPPTSLQNYTGRPVQPTAILDPGSAAAELAERQLAQSIILDDGELSRSTELWPGTAGTPQAWTEDNVLPAGTVAEGLVGVVDDRYGSLRLQWLPGVTSISSVGRETRAPQFEVHDTAKGAVRVVSFNLGNFFLTLDTADGGCGPNRSIDCRGASTQLELSRQRAKLLQAIDEVNADIIGLIEVENTPGVDAAGDLAAKLNDAAGEERYGTIETGVVGTDAIRVGILYRRDRVEATGAYALLDQSVDPRFRSGSNRPSLAQTFKAHDNNGAVTVVVNHLKSKGSDCDRFNDPDMNDGQGNCNLTRTMAAEALIDWIAGDPTNSNDPDFLILGDLNAYQMEDPVRAILAGSDDTSGSEDDYVRLDLRIDEEEGVDYTYIFDGLVGSLDHAIASPTLLPQVIGGGVWHINADEADLLDYRVENRPDGQVQAYRANPFRSSDHDPVVIGLVLRGDSTTTSVEEESETRLELDLSDQTPPHDVWTRVSHRRASHDSQRLPCSSPAGAIRED